LPCALKLSPDAVVIVLEQQCETPASLEAEVDRLWGIEQLRRSEPLSNGGILSAVSVSPDRILGKIARYKHYIAQRARPELYDVLQIRPVAVSGVLECMDGLVFGRRAQDVTQQPGFWELVPSGGIDVSDVTSTQEIDYRAQVLKELREEIGVGEGGVSKLTPFCLVEDRASHVIDIGIAMLCPLPLAALQRTHREASGEYQEICAIPVDGIDSFIGSAAPGLVPASIVLARQFLAWR
jgi:hypothetical protein